MPNAPLVALSTLSQLATSPRELVLASPLAKATMRNATSAARFPSGTAPITDTANGSIVFNSEGLNYMRLLPVISRSFTTTTYTSPAMRVTGWNYDQPNNLWVPMPIVDVGMSYSGNFFALTAIDSVTTYGQVTGFTINSGDAKIFATAAIAQNGGSMCIDTWGCQRIELEFRCTVTAGTNYANCFFMSA